MKTNNFDADFELSPGQWSRDLVVKQNNYPMLLDSDSESDNNWFGNLLFEFAPDEDEIVYATPDELIKTISWATFGITTLASLPPGPFGLLTILPDLIAVTKLQVDLVYSIANYYNKMEEVNPTILALIFANEAGVKIGSAIVDHVGSKVVVKTLNSSALRPITNKIAEKIGARITEKAVGRWIPFVFAPIFGAFSKTMTTRIGNEAVKLFQQNIEVLEPEETYYNEGEFINGRTTNYYRNR